MKKLFILTCICLYVPLMPLSAVDGILSVSPGWGFTSSLFADVNDPSTVKKGGTNGFVVIADYCGFFNDFFGIQAKTFFMMPFFGSSFDQLTADDTSQKNDFSTISAFSLGPVFRFELTKRIGLQVGVSGVVRTTLLKTKKSVQDSLSLKQPEAGLGLGVSGLYTLTENIYLKFGVNASIGWLVGNRVSTTVTDGQERVSRTKMSELYSYYMNISVYPYVGCSVQF